MKGSSSGKAGRRPLFVQSAPMRAEGGCTMNKMVELSEVDKYYGANHVVRRLDLAVHEGEFLTLLGPSGCGKTTTLRMIAGFEKPSGGQIRVGGENVEFPESEIGYEVAKGMFAPSRDDCRHPHQRKDNPV